MSRPPKYDTPEDLQAEIEKYFAKCKEDGSHLTVTGLAMACDLTRQGLIEYTEKSDQFSDTIKKAKSRVEEYVEQRLFSNSPTGCIFNLKNNFGWRDKTEKEISGQLGLSTILDEIDGTSADLPED